MVVPHRWFRSWFVLAWLCCGATGWAQTQPTFQGEDVLPAVLIDGKQAKIHTQGLYVTDRHYLVTGRLENGEDAQSRRALLLRFDRQHDMRVEFIDITPADAGEERLDHPGGFDVDAMGRLWIPISTSHHKGPSLISRYHVDPNKPLRAAQMELQFSCADHIGAICLDGDGQLHGASWDTKEVYTWDTKGTLVKRRHRSELLKDDEDWKLAVQDWKLMRQPDGGRIVAGGIDKSLASPLTTPRALVQVFDWKAGRLLHSFRLPNRDNVARPLTNEGLAVHKGELYLLPEDLGRGAKVLRFSL